MPNTEKHTIALDHLRDRLCNLLELHSRVDLVADSASRERTIRWLVDDLRCNLDELRSSDLARAFTSFVAHLPTEYGIAVLDSWLRDREQQLADKGVMVRGERDLLCVEGQDPHGRGQASTVQS